MSLKIGELAKRAGVNIQTIRYYERCKLLSPYSRRESGYRIYGEEEEKRLKFILQAKSLGFTIKETKELLRLNVSSTAKCEDVRKKAKEKIDELDKKIIGLRAIKDILKELVEDCAKGKTTAQCPILKAIKENKK